MIGVLESAIKGLAVRIKDAGFVSKSGALLQETTISTAGSNTVRAAAQIAPFADGKLVDVSPSGNDTVITFFQASATRVTRQDVYLMQCENEVTITGWINGNRVGMNDNADPELEIIKIIRKAKFTPDDGSPLRSIEIDFVGDNEGATLSRWGWDRPEFQYGGYPHRFFQHKFKFVYTLSTGCATQSVQILNPAC